MTLMADRSVGEGRRAYAEGALVRVRRVHLIAGAALIVAALAGCLRVRRVGRVAVRADSRAGESPEWSSPARLDGPTRANQVVV
jgi:hypothetical protein